MNGLIEISRGRMVLSLPTCSSALFGFLEYRTKGKRSRSFFGEGDYREGAPHSHFGPPSNMKFSRSSSPKHLPRVITQGQQLPSSSIRCGLSSRLLHLSLLLLISQQHTPLNHSLFTLLYTVLFNHCLAYADLSFFHTTVVSYNDGIPSFTLLCFLPLPTIPSHISQHSHWSWTWCLVNL